MQYLQSPRNTTHQLNRRFTVPATGTVYAIDGSGRVMVAEADVQWFLSQGFAPIANQGPDPFVNSGVIASGTSSVALGVLPPNFFIDSIVLQNLTANAINGGINIGSTVGGNDIVSALAVGANALTVIADASILKRAFSTTAPTSLFVSAVTSWNNANLNAKAILRPF